MMSNPHRHELHTAKTVTLTRDQLRRDDTEEAPAWGTMDHAPARTAAPKSRSNRVEWAIVLAATMMLGGLGLTAGATGLGIAAYAYSQGMVAPTIASASIAGPALVAATREAGDVKAPTAAAIAPVHTAPAAKAPEAIVTNDRDSDEMSVSQLRKYMTARAAAAESRSNTVRTVPAPPMRRTARSKTHYTRPAPARTTAAAVPNPTFEDDALDAIIHEPTPAAGIASAPSEYLLGTASAPVPAPITDGRTMTMANGIIVLDQPLDPVPVAIRADGDAAVYVDGEMLGGLPMAVVLDRGSHNVTILGAKGTTSFDLDANDGSAWCFNVKKDPKVSGCR